MRVVAGVLFVGLLAALDAVAAPTWAARCELPKDASGVTVIKLDANTGELIEGSLNIESGARLRIDFLGKNPFKYAYRFGTTSQLADSSTVAQYLQRLPLPAVPAIPGVEVGHARAVAKTDCDKEPIKAWLDALDERMNDLEARGKSLPTDKSLESARAFNSLYKTFFEETDSASFVTKDACVRSVGPVQKFMDASVPELSPDVASFPDKVEAFEQLLRNPPNNAGAAECAADRLGDKLKKIVETKVEVRNVIEGLQVAKKAHGVVVDLLQEPEVFHASRFPVLTGEATVVHVQLFRRNLRQESSAEQAVGEFDIKAGRGRVFVSAGALISFLPYRHVVRQQGRATPDGPVTTVFAYEEESDFIIAPAVLLNVRFVDIPSIGSAVHASFGVLGTQSALEVVAGPSFAFASERVFITVGIHAAKREELSGGFEVGQPVPEALTDPLPTKTGWKIGAAIGLSFRL